MKLLFLTNVPAPYRVDFFNELGKNCELTVTFEKASSDERAGSWSKTGFADFEGVIMKGRSVSADCAFCPGIVKYARDRSFDLRIVTGLGSPTTLLAVAVMRLFGLGYCVEADGAFAKKEGFIKRALKRFIVGGAKLCFSTSKECDRYFLQYGVKEDRIKRYPFTSLSSGDLVKAAELTAQKSGLREKLGFSENYAVVSVGRFKNGGGRIKGFDTLISAAALCGGDVGFYVIGEEPPAEYVELAREKGADNVHFIGFKSKDELALFYAAADAFALLTRGDVWGLVINEAMSFGLPVVTTDRCLAGTELVKDGENGFVIPPEDPEKAAEMIEMILKTPGMRERFGRRSAELIKDFTIENMAARHLELLS